MSLMGGVFGDSKDADTTAAPNALAEISRRLFEQTDPIRASLIGRSKSFLDGNQDVTQTPQYGALKTAAENQFNTAKDNIISSTPGGGGLISALANLQAQKAAALTAGTGSLADNEMSRSFALGTGTAPVALGGLGSAASSLGQIGAAQAAQSGQALQGLGMGAGMTLARKSSTPAATSGGSKAGGGAATTAAAA